MFGNCCPFVVPKVLLRASFVTQDANDAKQSLAVDYQPETILFNQVTLTDPSIDVDLVTGEITALKRFSGMVSLSLSCLREQTGTSVIDWGVFIEVEDGQGNWVPYEGSLRPITLNTQTTNEKRTIDYTIAVDINALQKFRFRHYTSDAAKQVSVISFAAANGLPASAGVILSMWGVKP
ncbi:hypothetical protein [Shewanella algae]|uniref:hypothetical protein n=1 Tax=Shewanella algae TaxID=38313 RepID=UPI001AAF9F42|nr:hypothetical protein [Shewanella algae]MBO2698117.1 hypothetical protein [Shewanella algae]